MSKQPPRKLVHTFILTTLLWSGITAEGHTQRRSHALWSVAFAYTGPQEVNLRFNVMLEGNWHIYSPRMEEGGPLPTKFSFVENPSFRIMGQIEELTIPAKFYDSTFMMNMIWFSGSAAFIQKISLQGGQAVVQGHIDFMTCNEQVCLPRERFEFQVDVNQQQRSKP